MEDLVDQSKQGNLQAYGLLIEHYERTVLAAVLAILNDKHLAEDVTQEAFLQAYQKIQSLRDATSFPYWLLKIARREAIRTARKQRRRSTLPIEHGDEPSLDHPDNALLDEEKQQLLQQLQKLTTNEQMTISLRFFDGHSTSEIANITGRPIGTVTKQLSRALAKLKSAYQKEKIR